jgi:glycosyltransferase involved in cell wall biosynthesis
LEKNGGLGNALRVGLAQAKHEIVARMDTDDICADGRFETQIRYLQEHPEVDLVGGQIEEFIGDEENIVAKRTVPLTDAEIKKYLAVRCPFNHPTVAFRKNVVEKVGGYADFYLLEDYYLWCRMAVAGCVLANVEQTLVYMRMTEGSYRRRGGKKYYQSLKKLEQYKRKNGITGFWKYRKNLFVRFMQCHLPNVIRERVYKKMRTHKDV